MLWLAAAAVFPAFARTPTDVTESEFALLPQYCRSVQGYKERFPGLAHQHWYDVMGPGFIHMHHYCYALIDLARAEKASTPASERLFMREDSTSEMNYVIQNVPPDFVLLPEIYTKLGHTWLLLKNPTKAKTAFEAAISRKQNYWPAYFYWADYQLNAGRRAEARTTVEEGLKYSPEAKTLQNLLRSIENQSGQPK